MQRDLAVGVTKLGTQVTAVDLSQFEGGQVSHPQKGRQLGLLAVLGQLARDLHERFLKNIRIVDPARQPAAEPQVYHAFESVVIASELLAERRFIARGGAPQNLGNLSQLVGLFVLHTL